MLYQPHRFSEKTPPLINLQMLIALGGGLFAALQALLIVIEGNILCLNDGCEVVEQLTTVPPIAFNVVGSLYFLTIFLALWQSARGVPGWLNFSRILLLAGMAAEGVLIGFQYYVAQVFCSYCLTIFALIVVLNLLMGLRQLLGALTVNAAVLIAFAALQFVPYSDLEEPDLSLGVYARLDGQPADSTIRSIFFSSTCPHCEEVIGTIDDTFTCSLEFNPVDTLDHSPLASLTPLKDYQPEVNRAQLRQFGIDEIPVLVVRGDSETRILKGKQAIDSYFSDNCRGEPQAVSQSSAQSTIRGESPVYQYIAPQVGDESCVIDTDC